MKELSRFLVLLIFVPVVGYAQQTDTLVKKLDSLNVQQDTLKNGQKNNIAPAAYEGAKLDFHTYSVLLADDIKQAVTKPLHTKGKDWLKVGGFAVVTGAVSLANKPVNDYAVTLHKNNPGLSSVSKYVTNFGGAYELYAIAGFYAYGLIFKSQKEKTTTALATQAYITAVGISFVAKYLAGEQRPYYTDPLTNKRGPIFHGPFYAFKKGPDGKRLGTENFSSFPSGHTTAAFAAATVYAMEYRDKPLIPILSYSAATLVGLSRITENKHWPVDILVGGMLGYLSGRQVVNNFHRYSKIKKSEKTALHPVSFNLQYFNKQIIPGLVYSF
ncbi:phosphatase PAP2 family protein [Segetibacter koreensis]|uniref:phosphatase PAP2 family protein n=1 Tax=Segetibacter koreensis TaxID=398037 RepID=UPI000379F491|nr:phosphatase PAP2 family protein [Segetibacter koreensis]